MKANELRIGNWVKGEFTKEPYQVYPHLFGQIFLSDDFPYDLEKETGIEGIPLTEEWLLKFGFEVDEFSEFFNIELPNREIIELSLDGTVLIGSDYNPAEFTDCCKYVHQLQNFYFALTGQELEIQKNNES